MVPKIVPKSKIRKIAATTSNKQLNGYHLIPEAQPLIKIPVERFTTILGRDAECDIVVEDASISRRHCLIQVMPRGLKVRDLHSTNGTLLNGMPITESFLMPDDLVQFGTVVFCVQNDAIPHGH